MMLHSGMPVQASDQMVDAHTPRRENRETVRLAWQNAAVAAYQRDERAALRGMQQELAARITYLTGRVLLPASIYVDGATHLAVATVDGVVFKMRRHDLHVQRPCGYCGTGAFESAAIWNAVDVGHALAIWEPRCDDCIPTDDPRWIED